MDVLPSQRRDSVLVSKGPSLVDPWNDGSMVQSPVLNLPTELIMLIFQQYRLLIGPPIALTHTCRRWRQIAINDASLWTNISIKTKPTLRNARLDRFISFLGMQLDRTADSLLDVEWFAEIGDQFFVATLQLIREKAPFSRWRTLTVDLSGESRETSPWSSVDAFTNLESLCVPKTTENTILTVIDRTITSQLKVLNLDTWDLLEVAHPMTSFVKSLTHISSLHARRILQTGNMPIPPANVVNLQLLIGTQHRFPHIETYCILRCTFDRNTEIDLRSMTTFIVRTLKIHPDCRVILPALRELRLGVLLIWNKASIEAPALDILHFTRPTGIPPPISNMNRSLLNPGYLLSPNTSISAGSHLCSTDVVAVLAKSPKVTNATLRFRNWADAQPVLERLIGFGTALNSRLVESDSLCPRLSELTLDFD